MLGWQCHFVSEDDLQALDWSVVGFVKLTQLAFASSGIQNDSGRQGLGTHKRKLGFQKFHHNKINDHASFFSLN